MQPLGVQTGFRDRKSADTEAGGQAGDGGPSDAPERTRARRGAVRSRNIRVARVTLRESARARECAQVLERAMADRPRTRRDCVDGPRPCPFVACRHHLYLDVSPSTGTIKLNFPQLELWELAETCALDVADAGPQPLDRVSGLLNVTRERIRQIEALALVKLGSLRDTRDLRDAR